MKNIKSFYEKIKSPRFTKSRTLAEITKTAIITGNISRAKKMFGTAERLLATGSNETKLLFPMSIFFRFPFMEMRHCTISDLFPKP
jgi:hypothetical protein